MPQARTTFAAMTASPHLLLSAHTGGVLRLILNRPAALNALSSDLMTLLQAALDGAATESVFARDALRIAVATERSGLEFYSRAAALATDPRGREIFERLAEDEKEHLGTLEQRYAELVATDPTLEARPTFLFFKGAAQGIFAEGAEKLRGGVDDLRALLIGIRCERDSHKFFKKYGDRFEDSEGKQIFLEFAEEEREHRDMLIKEYRALQARLGINRPGRRGSTAPPTH